MKTFLKICAVIGALLSLPVIFYGFVFLSAKESRDCSQMVIDSYEVRSGIDIPEVKAVSCYYDAETNRRVSVYELLVPVRQFVGSGGLTVTTDPNPLESTHLLGADELPDGGPLYTREGTKWGDQWQFVVEEETSRLWVEVLFAE